MDHVVALKYAANVSGWRHQSEVGLGNLDYPAYRPVIPITVPTSSGADGPTDEAVGGGKKEAEFSLIMYNMWR